MFQDGVETGENVAFDTVFFDERKKDKGTAVVVHQIPRNRDMDGILIERVEHPKQ